MINNNTLFGTDMERLFQVFDIVQSGMVLHGHAAENVSFPKQVQFYQMRHDIGDAMPANNNQTLFKRKASAFSENSKGLFTAPPKAEQHITKLNIIRNMQAEQFRSTVLIMTMAVPAQLASNSNTKPGTPSAENTELVPTEAKVTTMTHFTDNSGEAIEEPAKVVPMSDVKATNVVQMLYWRERQKIS